MPFGFLPSGNLSMARAGRSNSRQFELVLLCQILFYYRRAESRKALETGGRVTGYLDDGVLITGGQKAERHWRRHSRCRISVEIFRRAGGEVAGQAQPNPSGVAATRHGWTRRCRRAGIIRPRAGKNFAAAATTESGVGSLAATAQQKTHVSAAGGDSPAASRTRPLLSFRFHAAVEHSGRGVEALTPKGEIETRTNPPRNVRQIEMPFDFR